MVAGDWDPIEEPPLIANRREAWLCLGSGGALVVGFVGWAVFVVSAGKPSAIGIVAFPMFAAGIVLTIVFRKVRSRRNGYWESPFSTRRMFSLQWRTYRNIQRRDADLRSFATAWHFLREQHNEPLAHLVPRVSPPEDVQRRLPPPGESAH